MRATSSRNSTQNPSPGSFPWPNAHNMKMDRNIGTVFDLSWTQQVDEPLEMALNRLKLIPHRHYFAMAVNPGEQFYLFVVLSAWLIRKSQKAFDTPQESDDPNATIAMILDVVRRLVRRRRCFFLLLLFLLGRVFSFFFGRCGSSSQGVSVDFPPNRLKQGYGESVVYVLDRLADHALKANNFTWERSASFQSPSSTWTLSWPIFQCVSNSVTMTDPKSWRRKSNSRKRMTTARSSTWTRWRKKWRPNTAATRTSMTTPTSTSTSRPSRPAPTRSGLRLISTIDTNERSVRCNVPVDDFFDDKG